MAGMSRRFAEAGYSVPKYMLQAGGLSLFRHSVQSFEALFDQAQFLFVYREVHNTGAFIDHECDMLGLKRSVRIALDAPTGGQAETVAKGLLQAGLKEETEPLLIFNIDTIRSGFQLPASIENIDGYLEVFHGEGENWSFVRPVEGPGQKVAETTEKRRVSDLCSTGVYYFRKISSFLGAFDNEVSSGPSYANEYYVAPLYNHLIQRGLDIHYEIIDPEMVQFSGVPSEYEAFRAKIEQMLHDK